MKAAHALHQAIGDETSLNCSIGIATSRLVAKVVSDQAKPNGVLWVMPGMEAAFLAPLDIRRIPGVGKVFEENLRQIGIRKVGDLAKLEEAFLEKRFGKWGLALAGKARGADSGGWFDGEIGAEEEPKSISHEHTFGEDTADAGKIEATLAWLAEKVCRRLREHGLEARTVQLKLRFTDFHTITRAHSFDEPTAIDAELLAEIRRLFRANWKPGTKVRLLGVHVSGFEAGSGQMLLLDQGKHERWRKALDAADRMRDKFGETSVTLAGGLGGHHREKTHENPASLPGKDPRDREGKR